MEIKEILLSIDQSLKSISQSMEKLTVTMANGTFQKKQEPKPERNYDGEIDLNSKESLLFMKITDVYIAEERARIESGKSKKAARRLSVNIGEELVEFFSKELFSLRIEVERSKIGGLIVFSWNGTPLAVLKYLTDLGYSRSERFYEFINEVQTLAEEEFAVDKENVYFLIASLQNGVEKSYVENILGEAVESIHDFLINKKQVHNFIESYISGIPTYTHPKSNVYILASDLHPNVLANQILDDLERDSGLPDYYLFIDNVNNYEWQSWIGALVHQIKTLFKNEIEELKK
ncbi:hypothetical protein A8F94_14030 [Bacillus sp. FJAT-27225]|uniref:hypothetical protein n=1 Tax=Bacillus sp. FJAT-27225 TaxID=1743144 RepID=UPI00080C20DE|nr:hypothetical protein [Bacillus sp. FJAT-27225]OCA85961.1 hypothetical protein A8F94_14030 [Bacillus sp. FJAT-27225]